MKNMKYLFLLSITSAHVVSASHEFMLNCAHSLAASKALQAVITRTPQASTTQQAPAGAASTVLSWLNPFNYITTADQSNPAIMKLQAMQNAIQNYYDNAIIIGKSTGNTAQQNKAKRELESLIADYQQKLDEKNEDFIKYESLFKDLLKETQEQFSNLLPETTNDPLFTSFSDLLAKLNPFKPTSSANNDAASELMNKMEKAFELYYDNTTNIVQKAYQSKDETDKKELNKKAALEQFKALANEYQSNKDKEIFDAKKDDFKALFEQAQKLFGNANLEEEKNTAKGTSMYNQVTSYLSSFFAPAAEQDKKSEQSEKPAGPLNKAEAEAQEAQDLLQKMRDALGQTSKFDENIAAIESKIVYASTEGHQDSLTDLIQQKNDLLAAKADTFVPLFKQYVEKFGSFNEKSNPLGIVHTSITSKDKTQPIMNDAKLREILQQAQDKFKNDNLKVSLGLKGYKASLENLLNDVKSAKDLADDNN